MAARALRPTDRSPVKSPPLSGLAESLGAVRYRVVTKDDARSYAPLQDFSPGDPDDFDGDERLAVEEVHEILDRLRTGTAVEQTLAVLEKMTGELLALCGVTESSLLMRTGPKGEPTPVIPPGAAINVLARDIRYRGTGAGREVLRHTVSSLIPQLWKAWERPYVFAAVQPGNEASHAAFDAAGFLHLPGFAPEWEGNRQHIRLLAANAWVPLP